MFELQRLIFHLLFARHAAGTSARAIPSLCQKSVNFVYLSTLSAIGLSEQPSKHSSKIEVREAAEKKKISLLIAVLFQCEKLQKGEGSERFLLTLLVFNGLKCFHRLQ